MHVNSTDLDTAMRPPFMVPMIEQATNTGMIHDRFPNVCSANVCQINKRLSNTYSQYVKAHSHLAMSAFAFSKIMEAMVTKCKRNDWVLYPFPTSTSMFE